jgi:hypothetical protein
MQSAYQVIEDSQPNTIGTTLVSGVNQASGNSLMPQYYHHAESPRHPLNKSSSPKFQVNVSKIQMASSKETCKRLKKGVTHCNFSNLNPDKGLSGHVLHFESMRLEKNNVGGF